ATARTSLAIEQLVMLGYAALIGTLLALVLAVTQLGDLSGGGGLHSGLDDAVDGAIWWAALPAGLAVVSWLVRRASFRGNLLEELRRIP
ncbi:MAG TPA: hypothetical protein VIC57_04610, partial [Candidatus Dormibacteraeota bacterium]